MEGKFIKGEKLTPTQVASELLPILAMWGLSRATAIAATWQLWCMLNEMSDDGYAKAAKGMKIKAGAPNNASPQKAN